MRIPGMIDALDEAVRTKGKPFLGICVGLQLMAMRGLEHGVTPGLGWIEGEVSAITPSTRRSRSRIWAGTRCAWRAPMLLFDGIPTGESGLNAYFVHSYHLGAGRSERARRQHRLWWRDHRLHRP